MFCHLAGQYEDIMSWIRAMYSRREMIFSLVERANTDDDITVDAMIADSATCSSIRQTATPRRRNASMKVLP